MRLVPVSSCVAAVLASAASAASAGSAVAPPSPLPSLVATGAAAVARSPRGPGPRAARPGAAGPGRRAMWWQAGHAIVCDIAWREMSDGSRRAVRDLLALDPEYARFGPSCYWPDVIRDDPRYVVFAPSHYVNLPPGAAGYVAARDCARTLCVVEAIELFAGRLRDPTLPPAERLVALKFLGHLVGDIHQPLHAGYASDRGGNDIHACIPGDEDTNLHAVWDGFIVNRRLAALGLDWRSYGERLHADIHPVERAAWRELDPRVWANESYALTEDEAYEDVDREAGATSGCYGEEFVLRHLETTERRLKQAGVRLAALLDDIFGSS